MFKILTSTDNGLTFRPVSDFWIENKYINQYLIFTTPQGERLKIEMSAHKSALISWCERRLNNATNTKNKVKITNAS